MGEETRELKSGGLIKYNEKVGILFELPAISGFGAHFLAKGDDIAITVPTSPATADSMDDETQMFWSPGSWLEDELLTEVHEPFKTKHELELWIMCNPEAGSFIKPLYPHFYEMEVDK